MDSQPLQTRLAGANNRAIAGCFRRSILERGGLFTKVNRADGEGDLNNAPPKAAEDTLAQFMPREVLIDEFAGLANQGEVQR